MADRETDDLVVGDLKSLRSMVTCKVCFKMLYEPYTLSCGHTFCYSCLCTWFETNRLKKTCPKCRSRIEQQPAPSYVIKEIVNLFVTRGLLMSTEETQEEQAKLRAQESLQLERDKANKHELTGGIFRGCFRPRFSSSTRIIRDIEDGVDRCPVCSWEVESLVCQRCHLHFDETGRILDGPGDDTDDDPDDDALEEDVLHANSSDDELDEDVDLEDDEDELGFGGSLSSTAQQQQDEGHEERSYYRSYHGAGLEDDDEDEEGSEGSLRDFIDYGTGEEADPERSSDEGDGVTEDAEDSSSTDDALRPRTHTRQATLATSEVSVVSVDFDEGGAVSDGRRRRRPQGNLHALPSHLGSARATDVQPGLDGDPGSHASTAFGSRGASFQPEEVVSDTDDEPVVAGPPGRSRNSTSGQRKRLRTSSNVITERAPPPRASLATTGNDRRAIGATGPSPRLTGGELSSLTRQAGGAGAFDSYTIDSDSDGDVSMADSITTTYPRANGQSQSNPINVDVESSSDEWPRAPRRRRQGSDESVQASRRRRHFSSDGSVETPQQRRQRVRSSVAGVDVPSASGARRSSRAADPNPPSMSPAPARFGARHRHSALSRASPIHTARRHRTPDGSSRTRLDLDNLAPW